MHKLLKALLITVASLLVIVVATAIAFFVGIGLGALFVPNANTLIIFGILAYIAAFGLTFIQQLSSDCVARLSGTLCTWAVYAAVLVTFYVWHISCQGLGIEATFAALIAAPISLKAYAFGPALVIATFIFLVTCYSADR